MKKIMCAAIIVWLCFQLATASLPTPGLAQLRERFTLPLFQLRRSTARNVNTIWQPTLQTLKFRDNWGWPCTAVHMWLICSNRKLYKNTILCYRHTTQHSFCYKLSDHFHCANPPYTYVLRKDICLHSLAGENVLRLEKMFSMKYDANATSTVLLH